MRPLPQVPEPVARRPAAEETVYPLDPTLRERVMDIERVILELGNDLQDAKAHGAADDILLQTCRKLVARAKESLTGRDASEFTSGAST